MMFDVLSGEMGDDIELMNGPKQALDDEFEHLTGLNQRSRNLKSVNKYEFLRTAMIV